MKLRDINYEDMPEFTFIINKYDNAASICLLNGYINGKEAFEKAKGGENKEGSR